MADIISGKQRFRGEADSKVIRLRADETQDGAALEDNIRTKIRKHRRNVLLVSLGVALAAIVVIIAAILMLDGRTYSDYTVISSVNRDDTESAKYEAFNGGYIRYSDDGAAYYNIKGNAVWNQTFSMQNPQIKVCDEWVAIGDINGSTIYIFDTKGMIGSVDTSLSISQIEVAHQGIVAAVLEDSTANYINLYNTDGNKIYTVKTTLAGDGYPMDISISEDATKLIASYLYVNGDSIKTNVVFYNFSEVGQNETERVVGGFNHYDSTIVGDVQFIDSTTAVAIGENVMSIYQIKEYPSLQKEIELDNGIERVFFSSKYIGIVADDSESGNLYKLTVYDTNAKKVCETTFNTQYDDIRFDGKSVIMSSATEFSLVNLKGKVLTKLDVDLPIEGILPTNNRGRYIMVNSKYVQDIKLN
jgi:hypothetical protein